jgi:hypothetical protein
MVEYDCHGAGGKDKDRSDVKEMWWRMRPTLCLTRAEEGATTTTTIMGARGAMWMMLLAWQLYCTFPRKRMGEFDCCGSRGEDNYRSGDKEDLVVDADLKENVVVDAADTLSDKGRRGGNNNNDNHGGKGGNMDNVIGVAAVLYVSEEEDEGSSTVVAPEGRATIGLTMKRTRWWMLTSRRMW